MTRVTFDEAARTTAIDDPNLPPPRRLLLQGLTLRGQQLLLERVRSYAQARASIRARGEVSGGRLIGSYNSDRTRLHNGVEQWIPHDVLYLVYEVMSGGEPQYLRSHMDSYSINSYNTSQEDLVARVSITTLSFNPMSCDIGLPEECTCTQEMEEEGEQCAACEGGYDSDWCRAHDTYH
jgi:hypothetical protein